MNKKKKQNKRSIYDVPFVKDVSLREVSEGARLMLAGIEKTVNTYLESKVVHIWYIKDRGYDGELYLLVEFSTDVKKASSKEVARCEILLSESVDRVTFGEIMVMNATEECDPKSGIPFWNSVKLRKWLDNGLVYRIF